MENLLTWVENWRREFRLQSRTGGIGIDGKDTRENEKQGQERGKLKCGHSE